MRVFATAATLAATTFIGVQAHAAEVLIFGDRASEQGQVAQALTGAGNTVTNLSTSSVPTDLSGFDTIWVMNIFTSYGAALEQQLIDFVADGGGIYMTAERPCCDLANGSITNVINASLTSGSVTVSSFGGDVFGPFVYNSNAVGNIDADLQTGWIPSGPGQIEGVSGDNVVVTAQDSGRAVAAAWDESDLGSGRIAVFGDINWLTSVNADERQVVLNTQEFLFDGFVGVNPSPVPLPAAGWLMIAGLGGLGFMRRKKTA